MIPLIINIFGGPCTGKSTTATAVFSLLKMHDINIEYISEFAKDLTWEERFKTLNNQYYVWAKQHHKIWRIKNDVDVIVTDSPLLLSLVYGDTIKVFKNFVLNIFNSYNNINFLLERMDSYTEDGRYQNKKEACLVDDKMKEMLTNYNVLHKVIKCNYKSVNNIVKTVLDDEHITRKFVIEELTNG